ncbi:MAG: EXLDI protein [Leifsonia sp.]
MAEEDLALFTRAQELAGGNLSAAINQALQRFIEVREVTVHGGSEITVDVGPAGALHRKRFLGRRLVRWPQATTGGGLETFTVYRTAKDQFAVHVRRGPDWNSWTDEHDWDDPATWSMPDHPRRPESPDTLGSSGTSWWEFGEYTLKVYGDLAALAQSVPTELSDLIHRTLSTPDIEDLDI